LVLRKSTCVAIASNSPSLGTLPLLPKALVKTHREFVIVGEKPVNTEYRGSETSQVTGAYLVAMPDEVMRVPIPCNT